MIMFSTDLSGQFGLQPFHNHENNRANLTVLKGQVQKLPKAPAVGVGIFPAGFWSGFINGAVII